MTTETPESVAAGVEPDRLDMGLLAKTVGLTSAALIVVAVVLTFWFRVWVDAEREVKAASAIYPEMIENRLEAQRLLESYGVVDAESDTYRIPVDRAVQLMLEETVSTENRE